MSTVIRRTVCRVCARRSTIKFFLSSIDFYRIIVYNKI